MMIKRFAIALFLWPISYFAQQDAYDWQLWSEASVEYKQIPKLDLGLSFQNRLDRNVTRLRGNYLTFDASYKLGKGFRVLAAVRGASSARFDKLRFSAGLSRGFEFGKATSIKIRGLVQHQVFAGSDVRYEINVPQQNYRVRISLRQKLIKKTWLNLHSEPLWRKEGSQFGLYRLRSSVQIERSLPGPWTVNMGYMIQHGFNRGSNVQAVLIGVGYELKFKAKEKP